MALPGLFNVCRVAIHSHRTHSAFLARALSTTPHLAASAQARSSGDGHQTFRDLAGSDGIAVFSLRGRRDTTKFAAYLGHLLAEEPAGATCRLQYKMQAYSAPVCLSTAVKLATRVSDATVVFQPSNSTVTTRTGEQLQMQNLDVFKISSNLPAAPAATDSGTVPEDSSGAEAVCSAVKAAVEQQQPAGPFRAQTMESIRQLLSGVIAARDEVKDSASPLDIVCTVSRDSGHSGEIPPSRASSSEIPREGANDAERYRPFLVTVYPYTK